MFGEPEDKKPDIHNLPTPSLSPTPEAVSRQLPVSSYSPPFSPDSQLTALLERGVRAGLTSATPTQTAFNMDPSAVSSASSSSSSSIPAPTAAGIIAAQKRNQAFVHKYAFNHRDVPMGFSEEGTAYNRRRLESRILLYRAIKADLDGAIEESRAERRDLLGVVAQFRDDRDQGKPEGHANYVEARWAKDGIEDDIKLDQYLVEKLDKHISLYATWLAEVSAGLPSSRTRVRTAEEQKAAATNVGGCGLRPVCERSNVDLPDHASRQLAVGEHDGEARPRQRRNTATAAPSPPTPTARSARFDPFGSAKRPPR